jgi:hypothetical protein
MRKYLRLVLEPSLDQLPVFLGGRPAPVQCDNPPPFPLTAASEHQPICFNGLFDKSVNERMESRFVKIIRHPESDLEPHFLEFAFMQLFTKPLAHLFQPSKIGCCLGFAKLAEVRLIRKKSAIVLAI